MPESFVSIIQLGAFGVLTWVVWHVFSKTIPHIVASFERSLAEQRVQFMEQINQQRQTSIGAFSMLNTAIGSIRDAVTALTTAIAQMNGRKRRADK